MQSLYNKYRPKKFKELVGQDHITLLIESQLKSKCLPKSLIFYGPPGTGKTSIARLIASELNPSSYGLLEKDSSLEGSKDNIKNIQSEIYNKPFEGKYKTIIFEEAQEIGKAAFSSLLKITEEPPDHVHFVFTTTEFDKIPLSIKSRSQNHKFVRMTNGVIRGKLKEIIKKEKLNINDSLLSLIVASAGGSMRNGIVSLESIITACQSNQSENDIQSILGIISPAKITQFITSFINKDFTNLLKLKGIFNEENIDVQRTLYNLQQLLMDCRMWLAIPSLKEELHTDVSFFSEYTDKLIVNKDKKEALYLKKSIGSHLDRLYDLSLEFESNLRLTNNKTACIDRFIIKLAKSW